MTHADTPANLAADDAEGITRAPSDLYGFRRPPTLLPGEDPATVVQVVERTGGRWLGTPARYNAASLADLGSGAALAIDAGAGWRLSQEDTAALAKHARGIIAGRLEELRAELRAERISQGEVIELQGLVPFIDRGDVELLEWAGVPEFEDVADDDAPAAPPVPAVDQLRAGTVTGPAAVLFGEDADDVTAQRRALRAAGYSGPWVESDGRTTR